MTISSPLNHDRELHLLAACLRPLAARDRVEAIDTAAAASIDAERLVDLARRHRVSGFVERGLADAGIDLPDPAAARLAAQTGAARQQALRGAGEEVRIGGAFAAAGIDALFIKGATLGMRAHGTLGLKASWDVDVLVSRAQMNRAGAVLDGLGYRLSILHGVENPVHVRRFLSAHKEAVWHNEARGTAVELHTELADNRAAIPTVGLTSPRETVVLMPGAALQTLATGPLFAYLAVHGTGHLWGRLKWLADIAALLHDSDVEQLHAEAMALGAGHAPGTAILLAHELLGLAVPASLLATLQRDPAIGRLLRASRAAIAAPQDATDLLARPSREMIAQTRAQLWMIPGLRGRWGALRPYLTRPYLPWHLAVPGWALPFAILGALPFRLLRRPARLRREGQAGGNTASRP